jgi:transposase
LIPRKGPFNSICGRSPACRSSSRSYCDAVTGLSGNASTRTSYASRGIKYGDYLPLYRQEDILARYGVIIRRSTLCDWVAAASDLARPLYKLMCERVLESHVIHTDDTGVKMLAPGHCVNCKFWAYAGDASHPCAVYEFSETREGKEPRRFLSGFKGDLQADAYSGFDRVYAGGDVIEVACMAHCRRYWWEARNTDSRRAH